MNELVSIIIQLSMSKVGLDQMSLLSAPPITS